MLLVSVVNWIKCVLLLLFFLWLLPSSQRLGFYPDSQIYEAVANNIASGVGFSAAIEPPYEPTMIKEPLYPLIIAIVKAVFGSDVRAVIILQMLVNPLIAVLIYLLGMELFNEKVARLSSLLVAVIPAYGTISYILMPENFFMVLLLAAVLALVRASRSGNRMAYMLAGALLGVSALCKNAVLPLVLLYPAVLLYRAGIQRRKLAFNLVLFALTFTLVVTPWMLRNKEQLGFFSISVRGGALLSHQAAWAANFTADEWKAYGLYVLSGSLAQKLYPQVIGDNLGEYEYAVLMRRSYFSNLSKDKKEGEVERLLFREAAQNILQHPFKFLLLSLLVELQSSRFMVPVDLTMLKTPAGLDWLLSSIRFSLFLLGVLLTLLTIKGVLRCRGYLHEYAIVLTVIVTFHATSACLGIIPGSIQRYILPVTVFYAFFVVVALTKEGSEAISEKQNAMKSSATSRMARAEYDATTAN